MGNWEWGIGNGELGRGSSKLVVPHGCENFYSFLVTRLIKTGRMPVPQLFQKCYTGVSEARN